MSFLSRCEGSSRYAVSVASGKSGVGTSRDEATPRAGILIFFEEIGILFRYAAGLDYYGRHLLAGKR